MTGPLQHEVSDPQEIKIYRLTLPICAVWKPKRQKGCLLPIAVLCAENRVAEAMVFLVTELQHLPSVQNLCLKMVRYAMIRALIRNGREKRCRLNLVLA